MSAVLNHLIAHDKNGTVAWGGMRIVFLQYGHVVATKAAGLPIKLNKSVTHVDWSGDGVRVETSAGTISAKACLITVSTGVLASGARLGHGENNWVTYQVPNEMPARACYFVAWPCGHDYLFGNIGGQLGWELSNEDSSVTVDFAMEELVSLWVQMHASIFQRFSDRLPTILLLWGHMPL
jgi:hypothetical protein